MDEFSQKAKHHIKILTVLAIASSLSLGAYMFETKDITISIDDSEREVKTYDKTVESLLKSENISLEEGSYINYDLDQPLEDGMDIIIKTPKDYTIHMGEVKAQIKSVHTKVKDVLEELDITLSNKDVVTPGLEKELKPNDKIEITRLEEVYETVEEKIPFEEVTNKNKNLEEGKTKVAQEGKDGVKKIKIKKLYVDGELMSEEKVDETIAKEPVAKIIEKGAKKKEPVALASRGGLSSRNTKSTNKSNNNGFSAKRSFVAEATAYDLSFESCGKHPGDPGYGITASGTRVRPGVVSVDPNVIPLGTRLYIESLDGAKDYGYAVAEDTGGAIKGHRVDLFFEDRNQAKRFGRRRVKVHILN